MKVNPIQVISDFIRVKYPSQDSVVYEKVTYKENNGKITLDTQSTIVYNKRGMVEKTQEVGQKIDTEA